MIKQYTSSIDMLPMALDGVKKVTYKHRGKYGKKKKEVRIRQVTDDRWNDFMRIMNVPRGTI